MKAVIAVTGKDSMGIIAAVSSRCAEFGININDISQSVLKEYFAMIMVVNIEKLKIPFADFVDRLSLLGKESGLVIQTMHEDIFEAMHTV